MDISQKDALKRTMAFQDAMEEPSETFTAWEEFRLMATPVLGFLVIVGSLVALVWSVAALL
jgi:hypothetical protein